MPEGNQHQRAVPVSPASILRRLDQLLDLGRRKLMTAHLRLVTPTRATLASALMAKHSTLNIMPCRRPEPRRYSRRR